MNDTIYQVLLVEDNAGDARLLHEMLRESTSAQFELSRVARFDNAVQHLEAHRTDVVLLDLNLPDAQGLDTFTRMYQEIPQVPIVVLTGTDDKGLALQAVRRGAQDYLVKGQFGGDVLARSACYAMERKRTEVEAQSLLQESTLFGQVTTLIASSDDMSHALHQACAELARFLRVPQAGFAVLNQDQTAARVIADYHPADSASALGVVLPVADNPSMAYVLEHQAPLAVMDAQTDPRLGPVHDVLRQRSVASILIVPVAVGGQVLGTLGFDSYQQRLFSPSEIDLVQRVAGQMGQLVKRRQAEAGQARALNKALQATSALRENEEKYRLLFETMAQGVVYQSADGAITSANSAAERILGLTLDQMQGRTSLDPRWRSVHEDGTDFPGDQHPSMVALRTGERVQNVIMGVFHPAYEEVRWIEINAIPQFRPGESMPYQVYATFQDITLNRQAQEQVQASLREKEILLKEIHHRVKNNLQVISSLLELQATTIQDPPSLKAFQESQSRIRAIGLIHEMLYSSTNLANIEAPAYFQRLLDQVFSVYARPDRPVSAFLDCAPITLSIDLAIPCGLIINELVSNALIHAFPPDWTGERVVRIKLDSEEKDRLLLTVSDNGAGLREDQRPSSAQTLGLQLVGLLVRQLGGTIHIDGEYGTMFTMSFGAHGQATPNGGPE